MENKYKELILSNLYGLMEGSPKSLEDLLMRNFKYKFGFDPDSIKVTSTSKFIEDGKYKGCWIGIMTVCLIVNGEEYTITRDWGEEYEHDINHPSYCDEYFYEGVDCFSYKKYIEILNELNKQD